MSNSFESDAPIVAEGSVLSIIFQNDENGYKVFSIGKGEEDDDEIVCVGIVPMLAVGDNITAWGSYVNHHTYGRQLNVVRFEKSMPTTLKGVELYLGARNIKGVGPKRARQIIEAFGEDSFDVLENHPDKLAALKGISKKQAAAICEEFNDKKRSRAVFMQLQELGISFGASRRLYERYKEETISTILANPYRLADEIYGIGFKIADSIAYRIGIERDSSARIEAGIRFALTQAAANGHVYLPLSRLMQISCELLELHDIVLEERLSAMQVARTVWQDVIDETPVVYLRKYYTAEVFAAKKLLELMRADIEKYSDIDKEIAKFEKDGGVTLAKAQQQAVREVLNNGVCVITGGPGTGKTTTIKAVIELLDKLGMHIELAAPTGRAAKRMTEATGFEAKTLHRLLEISFSKDGESQHFGRNKENPLTCDVLIVDEASMIDVTLMSWLLNAVAHGTKLVLVGDVDQLPPIGAGNVLKDIIKSDCVKVVRLTEIFRQAQESAIVMNAHRINNGEYPLLNESGKDFFFMERHSVADVCATINELAVKRLPNYLSTNDIQDIQVLTPMRKGALGANELNKQLQSVLNPQKPGKRQREFQTGLFREGDKIMQTKNNYNMPWSNVRTFEDGTGIFNGDMGIVTAINDIDENMTVMFDGEKEVEYAYSQLDELSLAYATTVHKAQGSEYRAVIIPIHSGAPVLLTRNLLYTALTRAKELVVVVGLKETLYKMVDNNKEMARYTSLDTRLTRMGELLL